MKHLSSNPRINIKVDTIVLVNSLSDDELNALHGVVYNEVNRRLLRDVRDGNYPGLNEAETNVVYAHKNDAIIMYYTRCRGLGNERVNMMVARAVVEVHLELFTGRRHDKG